MKKWILNIIAAIMIASVVGCATDGTNGISEPDRGVIPGVEEPIKPPSLTNEWDSTARTPSIFVIQLMINERLAELDEANLF